MEDYKKMTQEEKTTLERLKESYESRLEDVNILLELEELENHDETPVILEKLRNEYGNINEYGLSSEFADYSKEEGKTIDTTSRFYRFQFSWGGPSEEIRIYGDGSIQFWFLDWGVGEHCDGSEFSDFIEYVTGLTVEEISHKVQAYINTGEDPQLF